MDRFEILRELIEHKKRKGEEKKPIYGTRKLSVGLVSCMLGFMMFLTPITAVAEGGQPRSIANETNYTISGKLMVSWITLEQITQRKTVMEYTLL